MWVGLGLVGLMWWVGLGWIEFFFYPPWQVGSKNPLNPTHAHPYWATCQRFSSTNVNYKPSFHIGILLICIFFNFIFLGHFPTCITSTNKQVKSMTSLIRFHTPKFYRNEDRLWYWNWLFCCIDQTIIVTMKPDIIYLM